MGRKLILATSNLGKIREISGLLEDMDVEVYRASELVPSLKISEDRLTFAGNAIKKAVAICEACGEVALADDSGLEVEALDGLPGIKSARFAGLNASDEDNNTLLLEKLAGLPIPRRRASFRCAMALAVPERVKSGSVGQIKIELIEESCAGIILEKAKGDGGFGYDPLFLYEPEGLTFAQIPLEVKNQVSHRGKALQRLMPVLRQILLK